MFSLYQEIPSDEKHTCLKPCDRIEKIAERIRSIAPYWNINESPENLMTNSTIDLKFVKRLWTNEDLNDFYAGLFLTEIKWLAYDVFIAMNYLFLLKISI